MLTVKFQVGDKVRVKEHIVRDSNKVDTLPVGYIGVITRIDTFPNGSYADLGDTWHWAYLDALELVEEEKKFEPCSNPHGMIPENLYLNGLLAENLYLNGLLGSYLDSCSGIEIYQSDNLTIKKQTKNNIMSKITTFAKNLVLSADEKLLRKYGLKDECGEFTDEAEDLVIAKLVKENESYLIELAKGMEEEEKNK
jgi:hypothetical protein